ncbi:MAG: ethanolamine utilization protein EutH, partial [Aristaeellaceae bacterium]
MGHRLPPGGQLPGDGGRLRKSVPGHPQDRGRDRGSDVQITKIILYVMAFGALLGGTDRILGNRFGFGQHFEEAFRLLGPIGLSMAGILCLV